VIGQGLPPGAGLSAARSVIYLGGTGIARPLTVLALRERYFEPRLRVVWQIVERAAARGQIRLDADPELAFDLLFGPLAYRILRGLPADEQTVRQVVDVALQSGRSSTWRCKASSLAPIDGGAPNRGRAVEVATLCQTAIAGEVSSGGGTIARPP
jgi:Tetracyclin repressor-like, C-terminal domain